MNTCPKHPAKSRTNWFGLVVMLLGLIELAQQYLPQILVDVAPKASAWIMLGVGATIIVLRFITKGPVSFRAKEFVP